MNGYCEGVNYDRYVNDPRWQCRSRVSPVICPFNPRAPLKREPAVIGWFPPDAAVAFVFILLKFIAVVVAPPLSVASPDN